MGYRKDQENVLAFLGKSVYNKNPENHHVLIDTAKEEMEAELKRIEDKIAKISKENKRRIYPFIYYSGHGVTLIVNG